MMEKKDAMVRAGELFDEGYNCAQAVALTFEDRLPIYRGNLASIASSFGGGMGRLREVCGAVTGMFMVAGLVCGYEDPGDDDEKAAHYKLIQDLANEFKAKHGTIICRELLNLESDENQSDSFVPSKRTESYYASRPCKQCVCDAAEIIDRYLDEYFGEE